MHRNQFSDKHNNTYNHNHNNNIGAVKEYANSSPNETKIKEQSICES